ncbi:MAG: cell division protein ZapA [Clostridia bacterium]|nr:cell division protein ZapA [Clostridia bacterium]
MKKTITVTIGGNDYRLVSAENEEYTMKVAEHVDGKIRELLSMGNVSVIDAAILTSINLADEYFKALETSESLRSQVKDYLEDSGRMKMEIADLRRQLERLKK